MILWYYKKVPLFCWFHHFLESRAEIVKFFRWSLVKTMTPERHFEINWPLAAHNITVLKNGIVSKNIESGLSLIFGSSKHVIQSCITTRNQLLLVECPVLKIELTSKSMLWLSYDICFHEVVEFIWVQANFYWEKRVWFNLSC